MSSAIVRPYTEADLEAFQRIHAASGMDYRLPDLNGPLFIAKWVVERNGKPTTLLAGKIDIETYLLSSGDDPAEKLEDIQILQPSYLSALWSNGIDDTFCVVPSQIDKHFSKRMIALGWAPVRSWLPYAINTATITP